MTKGAIYEVSFQRNSKQVLSRGPSQVNTGTLDIAVTECTLLSRFRKYTEQGKPEITRGDTWSSRTWSSSRIFRAPTCAASTSSGDLKPTLPESYRRPENSVTSCQANTVERVCVQHLSQSTKPQLLSHDALEVLHTQLHKALETHVKLKAES